jgi:APA family basic amino acid/polyamine antiporter
MFNEFLTSCLRKKQPVASEGPGLHRVLGALSLTSFGVGSVVGAGIFVMTGQAAANYAGPALCVSFVLSSVACFFTGLCYAELAASIHVVGSAYSYVYITLGEVFAWVVALCLTLEYLVSASAVAVGWGGAVQAGLREFNITIPALFASAPFVAENGSLQVSGSILNLPAVLILVILTAVLCVGIRESAHVNHVAVGLKFVVLILFVCYGIYFWASEPERFHSNMTPFIPPNEGSFGKYGISGVFRGAGAIFFAYVGFDMVCALSQECVDPAKAVPRGLFGTLALCTVFYVCVTLALTGMADYRKLNVDAPVIEALYLVQAPRLFRYLVEIGTIAGLTSVCLGSLLSMPRIILAAATDSLLPKTLGSVHPKYKTPFVASLVTGVSACLIAGLFPLDFLGELISFGTLIAFILVCCGVLRFRVTHPDFPRPFRVPWYPVTPILGIVFCVLQFGSLPAASIRNFFIYVVLGLIYYYFWGRKNVTLATLPDNVPLEDVVASPLEDPPQRSTGEAEPTVSEPVPASKDSSDPPT